MIEPISCNCGSKHKLNFTGGQENNNFKGITSSLPENASNLSTREAYNQAVSSVDKTQKEFIAPAGTAENLDIKG